MGVPHLGAGQTAARHAAGELFLRVREGGKAAHLIHDCRVNDSRGCTLDGLRGGGGAVIVLVEVLHLFLLEDFIQGAGRKINFCPAKRRTRKDRVYDISIMGG